jgi:hypothetical protein
MDEVVVPDVLGEIVGWRAWTVIGGVKLPLLRSVSHRSTVWHPDRWTLATCGPESHTCRKPGAANVAVPGEGHTCGMYAAKTREQLIKLGYQKQRKPTEPVFIGEVGLAGKVIPGSQGWRAAKGRIIQLYVPLQFWQYVDPLEQLYQVPVWLDDTQSVVPRTFGAEEGSRDGHWC